MIKYVLGGIFFLLLAFVTNLLIYLGAFKAVEITVQDELPIKMIYKDHIGAYHKIVPVIESVENWVKANGLDCTRSFGEYLDNPDIVDEDRLKSRGGCIVDQFPEQLPEEFKTQTLPARRYVHVTFEGSPSIGPFKVYPAARKFAAEERLKLAKSVVEIYTIKSEKEMTTHYLFAIE
jgi:AraC family transcriptional regulator